MPHRAWRQQCDRICQHLSLWPAFQTARTVLSYWSFRQEPDLSPLMTQYRTWGLPRCQGKTLIWHRWHPGWPLVPGAFGITEPAADLPLIEPATVDLILVPAVACDRRGYRLGYGGGFYDRMFSQPCWQQVQTVGMVFDFAYVERVPTAAWDRPLSAVCTETGIAAPTD